jgi:hypothetical protein
MMQSAQDRSGCDVSAGNDVVVRCALWDRLTEPLMRSAFIEVLDVLSENASQVPFTEQQNVVKAFASEAAEEALHDGVHVRMQAEDDLDAGALGDVVEHRAELAVVISDDEPWGIVERGVAELLSGPLLRGG